LQVSSFSYLHGGSWEFIYTQATSTYIEQWKNMGINSIVNYKGNYTR
jgi:hypothetical protein